MQLDTFEGRTSYGGGTPPREMRGSEKNLPRSSASERGDPVWSVRTAEITLPYSGGPNSRIEEGWDRGSDY
jgi:hypothetical protein